MKIFIYLALLLSSPLAFSADLKTVPPSKILFGSCAHQDKPMPILDSVIKEDPDLFMFLGDNVYGDTEDMAILAAKYQKLGENPRFKKLKASTQMIAIWDDHDFGENDAGKHYPQKEASRKIMLDFWQEPENSPRRSRPNGIYTSYIYGDGNQTVHVIMPDLRWNRDDLEEVNMLQNITSRLPKDMGPYKIIESGNASMLGETQWQWLEAELKKPATIKIIASSLQLLADFTGWEAWANFPQDRKRLFRIIKENKINGVLLVSGDTHWGEISKLDENLEYPLWEVTSSGLTEEWKAVSPNKNRIGDFTHSVNYGVLDIDWEKADPLITFGLKDEQGQVVMQQQFPLSDISPY